MIRVLPLTEYRSIIRACFAQDPDLIEKWHVKSGQGLDVCVKTTFDDMQAAELSFYVLFEDRDLVGYFGHEKAEAGNFLTGFFVAPKYRTKESMGVFWSIVKSKLGSKFFCGVFEKNTPANEFIKKNGGQAMMHVKKHGQTGIIYRIEDVSCQ